MPRRLLVNYFPQEKCTSVWRPATVLGQTILPVSAYFCFPCTRGRSSNIQCPTLNKLTGISNSWFMHIMKWKFVQKQNFFQLLTMRTSIIPYRRPAPNSQVILAGKFWEQAAQECFLRHTSNPPTPYQPALPPPTKVT